MKYHIGDKVTPVRDNPEGNRELFAFASTGTIVDIRGDRLYVQWDVEPSGHFHRLGGRILENQGWEIDDEDVTFAADNSFVVDSNSSFQEFIGVMGA